MFRLNQLILGAGDGMGSLVNTGESVLTWAQRLGIISAAIAFCIGGYYLIWGGERGRHKSIGWFIGSALGLIIVMGAKGLAEGVNSNIKFGSILFFWM
ncbi:hypothetical protein [Bacillus sp. BP-3]|uniref:hypothetical protein n=1 Tax=Bacillus sp. BP-3 TaxID=3022773 RepID=UPI00232DD4FE|nr:hypothetical protein [Bacillus sp. BP-3]MDC2867339.1 hypothetical protein [Bacillus sp. BP-3]